MTGGCGVSTDLDWLVLLVVEVDEVVVEEGVTGLTEMAEGRFGILSGLFGTGYRTVVNPDRD